MVLIQTGSEKSDQSATVPIYKTYFLTILEAFDMSHDFGTCKECGIDSK